MRVPSVCAECGSEAISRCAGCFSVAYCGTEHQKAAWPAHKPICSKPYGVKENKKVGRYMVATRNLSAGDIILREKAAVVGPSLEQSKPICLGCSSSLQQTQHLCSICRGPLCSPKCEKHPLHIEECKILKINPTALYCSVKNGTVFKKKQIAENANYQVILLIRAMLLKKTDVKKYKAVLGLQSHREEREEMGKTKTIKENVMPIIQMYRLQEAHEDMVQNICGIFDTNCFELCPSGAGDTISGIFPSAAMMMHSCYKNSRLTFSDDHVLTILARTDIKKGEPIHHTYARTFNTTTIRRIGLFSGKHFGCECVRCKDPTELNTFTSARLCTCGGTIIPEDPLDLTQDAVWKCEDCPSTLPSLQVAAQERDLMMELTSIGREDIIGLEEFISRHRKQLHQTHASLMEAKKHLSVGYGRFPGYSLETLPMGKLEKKIAYCKEIIEYVSILEPGISTQKGLTLYEQWMGEVEMVKRLKEEEKLNKEEFKKAMEDSLCLLEESVRIMRYEPENSIQGKLSFEIDLKLLTEKTNLSSL